MRVGQRVRLDGRPGKITDVWSDPENRGYDVDLDDGERRFVTQSGVSAGRLVPEGENR